MHAHHFLGREDGNPGAVHHHYNAGATCGSWWRGRPDEAGIPHTTMRDGTPNGYTFIDFEGNRYRMRFKAARRPENHQMEIAAPQAVAASRAAETEVVVNVFVGSERSHVELRFAPVSQPGDDLDWETLERFEGIDPTYAALYERESAWEGPDARPSPEPAPTGHLWRWALPANPAPGTYLIEVRHTDMWGQIDRARRLVRIQ